MVIIGQNDPPSRSNGPNHSTNHAHGVGNMFEQKPCVYQVEGTPFLIAKRKGPGIPFSEVDKILFLVSVGLSACLGDLVGIALDPHDTSTLPCPPGHGSRQLANPTPHIENCFTPFEIELTECRKIKQLV